MKNGVSYGLFALACVVVFILACAAYTEMELSPVLHEFPMPTGKFAVGLKEYSIVDTSQFDERFEQGARTVMATVFYPSSSPKGNTYPYQSAKIKALIHRYSRTFRWLPQSLWKHFLGGIRSYAQPDASLAKGRFPVIIFLPGIGGEALNNVSSEELASHGYCVIALEFPFDNQVTVLPDATLIELDPAFAQAIKHGDRDAIYAYRKDAHFAWLRSISSVIAFFKERDKDPQSPFFGALDFERLGLLGHSHGGGVVTDFCANTGLCKAGVNMDGWTKTANTMKVFSTPFLFLVNEQGMAELEELAKKIGPNAQLKKIAGAGHGAFSDKILLKQPLRWYLGSTTEDPQTVRKEIQYALVSFFDSILRNGSEQKKVGKHDYP